MMKMKLMRLQLLCKLNICNQLSNKQFKNSWNTHLLKSFFFLLRSPINRGAFKIPPPKVFNDRSLIFSQMEPPTNSQYELDSFVVNEVEAKRKRNQNVETQAMSPLERAERILKQRRREKRTAKYMELANISPPPSKKQKTRIYKVCNSSDDDFE